MITRTYFDRLRPELLNPTMQVFAAWRKELQDALCECAVTNRQSALIYDGMWTQPRKDIEDPTTNQGIAYRIDPSWSGPEEPVAKVEWWVDYPVIIDEGGEAIGNGYYLAHVERHPLFAGFVSEDGAIYATWGDWVDGMADTEFSEGNGPAECGYRIPTPKALRMWKEVKP